MIPEQKTLNERQLCEQERSRSGQKGPNGPLVVFQSDTRQPLPSVLFSTSASFLSPPLRFLLHRLLSRRCASSFCRRPVLCAVQTAHFILPANIIFLSKPFTASLAFFLRILRSRLAASTHNYWCVLPRQFIPLARRGAKTILIWAAAVRVPSNRPPSPPIPAPPPFSTGGSSGPMDSHTIKVWLLV